MSNYDVEIHPDYVHFKIDEHRSNGVLFYIKDSSGDILATYLTDLDYLNNLCADIQSATQDSRPGEEANGH